METDKDNNEEQDPKRNLAAIGYPNMSDDQKAMVKDALQNHLIEFANKQSIKLDNITQMVDSTKEYLNTFVILGYDYKGNPVHATCATTPQEMDSLNSLMNRYIRHGEA